MELHLAPTKEWMNEWIMRGSGSSVDKTCPSFVYTHTHMKLYIHPCTYIRFKIRGRFTMMFIVGIIFRVRMYFFLLITVEDNHSDNKHTHR